MTIIFKVEDDGGFVCGDPDSRITDYAEPGCPLALKAALGTAQADEAASFMLAHARSWRATHEPPSMASRFAKEDARNWAKLLPPVVDMVGVTLTRTQCDEVGRILRIYQREARGNEAAVFRIGDLIERFDHAETK